MTRPDISLALEGEASSAPPDKMATPWLTKEQIFKVTLALGMLVTGSINTISTKAADQATTTNRYGESVQFNHPFFQALCMFIGEFSCLLAYHFQRLRAAQGKNPDFKLAKPHSPLIFFVPALCDMTGTSLMYVGLSLTSASVFQMLRGSVVIFTGIFSVLFLKNQDGSRRRLQPYQWIGMGFVLVGAGVVGSASYVCPAGGASAASDQSKALLGNTLIIIAQVLVAVQMVVEETFIGGYDVPPLQVVGWEGTWGIASVSVVLAIMYYVPAPEAFCLYPAAGSYPAHCDHFEDAYDALVQMSHNWIVGFMLVLNIFSIAFFNYFGVSVTKYMSATHRMVLDSMRTMVIWAFSLGIGWESFCYVQVPGFVLLLAGTSIYTGILRLPCLRYADKDGTEAGGKAPELSANGEDPSKSLLENGGEGGD